MTVFLISYLLCVLILRKSVTLRRRWEPKSELYNRFAIKMLDLITEILIQNVSFTETDE